MHKVLRAALFIIFAALAGLVLTPRCALAVDKTYTDGNGIQYVLGQNDDGTTYTMTVSAPNGSGAMQDYEQDNLGARGYDSERSQITKIVIGEGITSIGNYAFSNFDNLTSIYMSGSVTSIGDDAFFECRNLASINMSGSVTSIGNEAFYECESLPPRMALYGVESIGDAAFLGCTGLTSVMIPGSAKSIGADVFSGCTSLEKVELEDGIGSISDRVFAHCTSLKEIKIPSSVTSIGDYAFRECTSLEKIEIPGSVQSIGDNAFYLCDGLASVTMEKGVKTIHDNAFYDCQNLTSIEIPEGVETIGNQAFFNCTKLALIEIPSSVISIGDDTFKNCSSLETVIFPDSLSTDVAKTNLDAKTTQVKYEVVGGDNREVKITDVIPGAGKEGQKVELSGEISGFPIVEVEERVRHLVSVVGHGHRGGTATCVKKAECAICGEEYGGLSDHTIEHPTTPAAAPTCTKDGNKAGGICSVCNQEIDPERIPATGHNYVDGVCTKCGEKESEKPNPNPGETPHEHTNLVKIEGKAPTHLTEGNRAYYYCAGCGKYFADAAGTEEIRPEDAVLPTTGHSARGGWQYDGSSHWKTCGECGEVLERENHEFEWVIDRKPTEETEGLRHKECVVCGYERGQVRTPVLGSEDEETDGGSLPEPVDQESDGDFSEPSANPQTGDASPILPVCFLAAGALGALLCGKKRRV